MSSADSLAVTETQIRERMRAYREAGFRERAMPHIIFSPADHKCPWPGCTVTIAGIDFRLELMGDEEAYQRWMHAWWKGAGLVGRCPGCGNHVLFSMDAKVPIQDVVGYEEALLPDDWHQHAYLLP